MLILAFNIHPVKASGTIYIRADGSIDPPSAPISTFDNVTYTLTGNVTSDADGIVVEKDSIIVDGQGYTIRGTGFGTGITLSGRSDVTVKNTKINTFDHGCGIELRYSHYSDISGNNITNNRYGIYLTYSTNNSVSENNITANDWYGIYLFYSSSNSISGNNITKNIGLGLSTSGSSGNVFRNNSLIDNYFNIHISATTLSNFRSIDIDTSNTVDGRPVYYLIDKHNLLIDNSTFPEVGYLALVDSDEIIVEGLEVKGILFAYTTNSTINNNNITNSGTGVYLCGSYDDIVSQNNIKNNSMGVFLDNYAFNNTVCSNNLEDNGDGVFLYNYAFNNTICSNNLESNFHGIYANTGSDNNISENNITNSNSGILVLGSDHNFISGNKIASFNTQPYGTLIELGNSHNNVLKNNTIETAPGLYGIRVMGYELSDFIHTIDSSNTVDGKPIYYFVNAKNLTISHPEEVGYLALINSSNIIVEGLELSNNFDGILLAYTTNSCIVNNNMTYNWYGACLYASTNNTIRGNKMANNVGFLLFNSSDNIIYHNSFSNFWEQVDFLTLAPSINVWNEGYPSGGNYWSNYAGTDLNTGPFQNETGSDGIGDVPYAIDENNTDKYPLTKPYPWASNDVGVTSLALSKNVVGQGYNLSATVMIFNYGNDTETVNATICANQTVICKSYNIELTSRSFTIVSFTWNTSGFAYGNYTINAYVEPVPNETDIVDNNVTCIFRVHAGVPGDISGPTQGVYDGTTNMRDIQYLILLFNTNPGSPNWKPNADVNNDATVNMRDIQIAILNFNKHE
jgi:parallel beta-helix repeat protein